MDIKSYDSLVRSNISGVKIQEDVRLSDLRPLESRIHRATSKAMPRSSHCRIFPFVGYGSPYVVRFASECLYSVSPYIKCKLSMEDTMLR